MQEEKHRRVLCECSSKGKRAGLGARRCRFDSCRSRQPFPSYGRRYHPRRENRRPRHRSDWRDGAMYARLVRRSKKRKGRKLLLDNVWMCQRSTLPGSIPGPRANETSPRVHRVFGGEWANISLLRRSRAIVLDNFWCESASRPLSVTNGSPERRAIHERGQKPT